MTSASAFATASPSITHADRANALRFLAVDAVEKAKSGHPGMPMGMADAATILFTEFLKFSAADPAWPDRDRFVLSAGHGSMLLYALLYLTGYEDTTREELMRFRQLGARTAGHPEYGHAAGIETTTGPLGQGLANAVGMALAERMLNARFGNELADHRTWVIAGDGCLMEGISQEAITLAGHLKLNKLIVLFDDNRISIDGPTSLSTSEDTLTRFSASGWAVHSVDGHDPDAIRETLTLATQSDRPVLVACRTIIGFGAPQKSGTAATHGAPLGAEEIAGTREALGWPHAPFEVPDAVLQEWRQAGRRGEQEYASWTARLNAAEEGLRQEFERRMRRELPQGYPALIASCKKRAAEEAPKEATRKSSGEMITALAPYLPELVGGSADLTGSNLTKSADMKPVTAGDYDGQYIYYGIREHGMAAAMNGLALHGGFIPFGGTFLVFSDYCRPAIRLSALMGQRVIYVMTHDSIGLGEDGPTHQPVEHLAALRAIPNLQVFRPCDRVETIEAWALALASPDSPSLFCLSRQSVPTQRRAHTDENLTARGGYILREAEGGAPQAVLIATGTEVSLAAEAQEKLQKSGIPTRLVSLPCWELFEAQPASYREKVLPPEVLKVGVEAALPMGWERWLGPDGVFIGMQGFGASAPAEDLYAHFGITADAIVEAVKKRT